MARRVVVGGVGLEEETAEEVAVRRLVERPTRVRWSAREWVERRVAMLAPIPEEAPVTTMWRAIVESREEWCFIVGGMWDVGWWMWDGGWDVG